LPPSPFVRHPPPGRTGSSSGKLGPAATRSRPRPTRGNGGRWEGRRCGFAASRVGGGMVARRRVPAGKLGAAATPFRPGSLAAATRRNGGRWEGRRCGFAARRVGGGMVARRRVPVGKLGAPLLAGMEEGGKGGGAASPRDGLAAGWWLAAGSRLGSLGRRYSREWRKVGREEVRLRRETGWRRDGGTPPGPGRPRRRQAPASGWGRAERRPGSRWSVIAAGRSVPVPSSLPPFLASWEWLGPSRAAAG